MSLIPYRGARTADSEHFKPEAVNPDKSLVAAEVGLKLKCRSRLATR